MASVRRVGSGFADDDAGGNGRISNGDEPLEILDNHHALAPVQSRDPLALSLQALEDVGLVTEKMPVRTHRGAIMRIQSQVTVGVDRRICLAWQVPHKYFFDGYRLLGYRRTNGFAQEVDLARLEAHGQKIIDSRYNDRKEETQLDEGEYFYTFVLYRTRFFKCIEVKPDIVQFSEIVPGASKTLQHLKDTYEGRKLIGKILQQNAELKRLMGKQAHASGAGGSGGSLAELMAAEQAEIDQLKQSPHWKQRKKPEREFLIETIRKKYRDLMGRQ